MGTVAVQGIFLFISKSLLEHGLCPYEEFGC